MNKDNINLNDNNENDTVVILSENNIDNSNTSYNTTKDFSKNYRPVNDIAERRQNNGDSQTAAEKYRSSVLLASDQRKSKITENRNKIIFTAIVCVISILTGCISGNLSAKHEIKKELNKPAESTYPIYTLPPVEGESSPIITPLSDTTPSEPEKPTVTQSAVYVTDNIPVIASTNASVAKSAKDIYNDVVTSVVGITSKITISNNFFGHSYVGESSGSGFVVSSDGYILTNYHVIEGGSDITVSFFDGSKKSAVVVGYDTDKDIAVLKTDMHDINYVELGESDDLSVGDTVLIIGNPLGKLSYTLTSGVVSALNRTIADDISSINMFQTDAAINSGNSGGPVFDMNGEVVGIATSKYTSSNIEGLSFCIPIDDVKTEINDIVAFGYAKNKPLLGISTQALTAATASAHKLPRGLHIVEIGSGTAADKAGLKPEDVITAINSESVTTIAEIKVKLREFKSGDEIKVTYFRNGQYYTAEVKLDEKVPAEPRTSYSNVYDL